jgi:hypothetical protein
MCEAKTWKIGGYGVRTTAAKNGETTVRETSGGGRRGEW